MSDDYGTDDDHVRMLKHLAFCEGDQSGGPEAVTWALDRIAALHAVRAERDMANALAKDTADSAIKIMSDGCTKHDGLSFDDFVAQGGDGCPLCLTADLAAARAERDGLAKALRGVSKSIEAHMYLNDPPTDANMDEYDYMMKPLWEAARAALAALPKEES